MFSDIVQRFDTGLNVLYQERAARKAQGQKIVDLVSGNVNRAGFVFPQAALEQALVAGARKARIYAPDPLGQKPARDAIRAYYRAEGLTIPAEQIVLTPGTSVSYWYLFRLLANPGDEILCPTPSYPLLDSIAELCGVKLTSYRLREQDRWTIDFAHLESAITPRNRAIVLISPHNPTGAVATEEEIEQLVRIAEKHQLPIISDEVFSEFLFNTKHLPRPATNSRHSRESGNPAASTSLDPRFRGGDVLVFTLNGLSKMFALPGVKIGWIAVTGDTAQVKTALHALDLISDTFLPVNEAAQFALPMIFKKGKSILSGFRKDVAKRAQAMMKGLEGVPGLSFNRPEGGFYLTVRIDADIPEDTFSLNLLRQHGLLVHPGYFYDLEGNHFVMSFVSKEAAQAGIVIEKMLRNF